MKTALGIAILCSSRWLQIEVTARHESDVTHEHRASYGRGLTERGLQSVAHERGPADGVDLWGLVVAPEVLGHVRVQPVVAESQAVADHVHNGRDAHGVQVLAVGHLHLHAFLESVVGLRLELVR